MSESFVRYADPLLNFDYLTCTSQPLLLYNNVSGRLLAPDKQTLYMDRQGRPFSNTNSTTIQGRNPPNLAKKQAGDLVQVTFDISDLNELTMLQVPRSQTLKVFVPFAIIAAATGQHCLVPSFSTYLIPPHSKLF